jgi:hypothetical protein
MRVASFLAGITTATPPTGPGVDVDMARMLAVLPVASEGACATRLDGADAREGSTNLDACPTRMGSTVR